MTRAGRVGRGTPWAAAAVLLGAVIVALPSVAGGHPLAPSLLELRETAPGEVTVRWKTPRQRAPAAEVAPVLPVDCEQVGAAESGEAEGALLARWKVRCDEGALAGRAVSVHGIAASRADVLVRGTSADGGKFHAVLTADRPSFTIPERASTATVSLDYLRLGVSHILGGADHLLFVLGLVLLVSGWRSLAITITAFTVGHAATLTAAALGAVRFPVRPIEAAIALSIVLLARELAVGERPGWIRRFPWSVAGAFGLLHGFGFAGALADAGLPAGDVPAALLSFNVGIELGQLAFVVVVLAVRACASRLFAPAVLSRWPAYAMGSLGAFWFLERL